jgi:hypothetical protein
MRGSGRGAHIGPGSVGLVLRRGRERHTPRRAEGGCVRESEWACGRPPDALLRGCRSRPRPDIVAWRHDPEGQGLEGNLSGDWGGAVAEVAGVPLSLR